MRFLTPYGYRPPDLDGMGWWRGWYGQWQSLTNDYVYGEVYHNNGDNTPYLKGWANEDGNKFGAIYLGN